MRRSVPLTGKAVYVKAVTGVDMLRSTGICINTITDRTILVRIIPIHISGLIIADRNRFAVYSISHIFKNLTNIGITGIIRS